MSSLVIIVRCPRCGSMDAESVEPVHIEFDRMKCHTCGHEQLCDDHQIRFTWNELVAPSDVRKDQWHWLPTGRFNSLWRALGSKRSHGRDVYDRLRVAYDEPHRVYHGSRHIGACLRLVDDRDVRASAGRIDEVEAALWFHDAVYDTHAADNEKRSAVMADEALREAGVAVEVAARVAGCVRATADHVAATADEALMMDIDLSILGADSADYARFEEGIRREYAWVGDAPFAAARAAALRRFSDRPFIYATPHLRQRFESKARTNIAGSLARLGGPPPP